MTVPAHSQVDAAVPVEAVANGTVTLTTVLTTQDGQQLTEPVDVPLTVNPAWENWTTLVDIVIAMGLLVVVGVARARRTGEPPPGRRPCTVPRIPRSSPAAASPRSTRARRRRRGPPGQGPAAEPPLRIRTPTTTAPQTTHPTQTTERSRPRELRPPCPARPAPPPPGRRLQPLSLMQASVLMAAGSTISRLLGFVRNYMFGMILAGSMSSAASAFSAANTLPNTVSAAGGRRHPERDPGAGDRAGREAPGPRRRLHLPPG